MSLLGLGMLLAHVSSSLANASSSLTNISSTLDDGGCQSPSDYPVTNYNMYQCAMCFQVNCAVVQMFSDLRSKYPISVLWMIWYILGILKPIHQPRLYFLVHLCIKSNFMFSFPHSDSHISFYKINNLKLKYKLLQHYSILESLTGLYFH